MGDSEEKKHAIADEPDKSVNLIEQSLVGIFVYQDGFLLYVNAKAAEIFGFTKGELSSKPLMELITEDDHALSADNITRLLEGKIKDIHAYVRGKRKDGTIIELEVQGTPAEFNGRPAMTGTFLDITERRKMEAEIQKAQKLESLSAFASGIANEYNNILTALIGNLALAKMYTKPGYEVYDVLTEAEKASLRAKDLTSQLLSFAKGDSLAKKTIFLQELIRQLTSSSPEGPAVACETTLPGNLWPVIADENQISLALNNLLLRARQSTPPGGSIRIAANNLYLEASTSLPLREGRYVILTIEDHGAGIPEKELQLLFDPFSAVEKNGGALGLAGSFAIIRKHEGHIIAESSPVTGTIFRIYIPAAEERSPLPHGAIMTPPSQAGKILVMDDEEIVRVVVSRLLLQCGFEAEVAKDGAEMLRLYREAKEAGRPFEAVILDIIIQEGMGGQEAMKHLIAYDPSVKVIVSSGYSHDPIMRNFREYGFTGFLPKPYKLEELRRVLNEVMSHPQ